MNEGPILQAFWRRVGLGTPDVRLDLLRRYAGRRVPRPASWDVAAVRREAAFGKTPLECFCCLSRDRHTYWHHIIQIQHGGSNDGMNRVGICHQCHRRLHPWLPDIGPDTRQKPLMLLCELMKDKEFMVVHD
jgi:5-methylcytosine-specific restriction endonuclease McrA